MEPLAEAIKTHLGIRGVEIAGTQHKISIFADDVILTLTDVESSLRNTTEVLDLFGSLTYYWVNSSKSIVLDFLLATQMKQNLQTSFPYVWRDSSIPYLGNNLTKIISWFSRGEHPTSSEVDPTRNK